jgi:hypothetical protein
MCDRTIPTGAATEVEGFVLTGLYTLDLHAQLFQMQDADLRQETGHRPGRLTVRY